MRRREFESETSIRKIRSILREPTFSAKNLRASDVFLLGSDVVSTVEWLPEILKESRAYETSRSIQPTTECHIPQDPIP
jgi:hypothetical protein